MYAFDLEKKKNHIKHVQYLTQCLKQPILYSEEKKKKKKTAEKLLEKKHNLSLIEH